jgi:AraC-like DNA-binding protein
LNELVLREVFGSQSAEKILGKTDQDFQPPHLAEAFHAEDRGVMNSGKTIPNQIWLVPHVNGSPKWYSSTKTPMRGSKGQIVGTVGVMFLVDTPKDRETHFRELPPVISHLEQNYTAEVSMKEMALMAGLSSTQFNLRFRQFLRMTPTEYLVKLRIELAQRLLAHSDKQLVEIGVEACFYDQSQFTKVFKKQAGITPRIYRKRLR